MVAAAPINYALPTMSTTTSTTTSVAVPPPTYVFATTGVTGQQIPPPISSASPASPFSYGSTPGVNATSPYGSSGTSPVHGSGYGSSAQPSYGVANHTSDTIPTTNDVYVGGSYDDAPPPYEAAD